MRLLVLASRDRRNRNFAGGDLTLTEVSKNLAAKGTLVTYFCSSFKGATPEEWVGGVRIVRRGGLWTTAARAFIFYLKNRHAFDAVIQEVIGGLRIPYFAALYVGKPFVGVWYQRNDQIFRFQYNRLVGIVLKPLEYALAMAHRSKLLLCPSRRTAKDLACLGLSPRRLRLYVPGMDETILKLSTVASTSDRKDLIVWLGKIRKYKRTQDAILTMDRLVKMVPSSRLMVVGIPEDRKYLNHLQRLRERLDLRGIVGFKFGVTEEEKGQLLLQTKALLVTSPIEGFANVASEANACGAPAVVTEGVPLDVVTQGLNGIRVKIGDVDAMAEACRMLLTDQPIFARMSEASIECAKNRNWARTSETFLATLEDAMINERD